MATSKFTQLFKYTAALVCHLARQNDIYYASCKIFVMPTWFNLYRNKIYVSRDFFFLILLASEFIGFNTNCIANHPVQIPDIKTNFNSEDIMRLFSHLSDF